MPYPSIFLVLVDLFYIVIAFFRAVLSVVLLPLCCTYICRVFGACVDVAFFVMLSVRLFVQYWILLFFSVGRCCSIVLLASRYFLCCP